MSDQNVLEALLKTHQDQMQQQEKHHQKIYEFHEKQNEINAKTNDALTKLAHQIERSNDRHEVNDGRILDAENFIDYAKPIVDRSAWIQSFWSSFAQKILLPAIVLAILASAGFNLMTKSEVSQKQEQQK